MTEVASNGIIIENEESANEMLKNQLLQQFGNDPEKIREAAKNAANQLYKQFNLVAESIDGVKVDEEVKLDEEAKKVKEESIEEKRDTEHEIKVTQVEKTNNPTGYLDVPEGLYFWSPDIWNGKALHCIPDKVIEREGRATLLMVVLVAPACGRNREGKIVNLPEGSRCIVTVSVAWSPIVPLAKVIEGRPVIWACPTAVDKETGKIRFANQGEELHKYEVGDGGYEYGLKIMYDPDPKNPSKPRLIDLETLRGATK